MQTKGNLFMRDDTFFGVCEGLGEDLRIPSNLFRVAFALGFFFSATGAVAIYLALGALVLVSRLVFSPGRALKASGEGKAATLAAVPASTKQVARDVEEEPQLAAAA